MSPQHTVVLNFQNPPGTKSMKVADTTHICAVLQEAKTTSAKEKLT